MNMTADVSVQRARLAELKIQEAELLMEAANIERDLAAKEGEILKLRGQIEQLTRGLSHLAYGPVTPRVGSEVIVKAEVTGNAPATKTKKHGRPRLSDIENAGGSSSQPSLGAVIEKIVNESNGVSKPELATKILASGYVSLSDDFETMIDQAIYRLKKKDKIYRHPDSLLFFKKEAA
jgi:hypothetical protein